MCLWCKGGRVMGKYSLIKFISDFFAGLGFIFTITPIILYYFIHDNYERYIWIINGPYPFSHFGSGPFQLFMYLSLLIVGAALIVISMILKRVKKK
jgi:hypothetical protein